MRYITGVAMVLAAAGSLAACGASNAGGPAGSAQHGTTATADHGDPRTAAQLTADGRLAQSASLVLSDFPNGWQSKPDDSTTTSDDARSAATFARCLNIDPAFIRASDDNDGSFSSPDFTGPDGSETVSSNVGLEPTESDANEIVGAFAQPSATTCLGDFVNSEIKSSLAQDSKDLNGATIGRATIGRVQFPQLDERTVALRVDVPISAQGLSLDAYLDLVIVQQGRSAALITFEDVGSAFPTADAEKYATLVAQRLAALPLR